VPRRVQTGETHNPEEIKPKAPSIFLSCEVLLNSQGEVPEEEGRSTTEMEAILLPETDTSEFNLAIHRPGMRATRLVQAGKR